MVEMREPRKFTVLLPILRPPTLLPFAVQSVLSQTEPDFELCILCDGAPPDTLACAQALATTDARISAYAFPKGTRNGEEHRETLLKGSQATFVAQIADDDLWFPDHLARLAHHLRKADFVSLRQIRVVDEMRLVTAPSFGHLRDAATRERMLTEPFNFFGPTEAGYRLDAYRGLKVGWSPAPQTIHSDLFMWRKFVARPDLRFASAQDVTSLKFAAKTWDGLPVEERVAATSDHAARLADPKGRAVLRRQGKAALARGLRARDAALLFRHDPVAAAPLIMQKCMFLIRDRLHPER